MSADGSWPGKRRRTRSSEQPPVSLMTTVNVKFVVGVPDVGDTEWSMTDRMCVVQLPAAATAWIDPDSGSIAGTNSQLAAITIAARAVRRVVRRAVVPRARTEVFVIVASEPTAAPIRHGRWAVGRAS